MRLQTPYLLWSGGREMRCYLFIIGSREQWSREERSAVLENDAAALDYACRLIGELRASGRNDDPGLAVTVSDESGQRILSTPFLPASA